MSITFGCNPQICILTFFVVWTWCSIYLVLDFVQIELALNKVVYCPLYWRHLDFAVYQVISYGSALSMKKKQTSEYDQEIPQSHTVDQPTAP